VIEMDKCELCKGALVLHHKAMPRKCTDGKRRQTVWYNCIDCGWKQSEEFVVGYSGE